MVIFYKKWKKYNEIQLTKNKMDLNIEKITNLPSSLGYNFCMHFRFPKFRIGQRNRGKMQAENSEHGKE